MNKTGFLHRLLSEWVINLAAFRVRRSPQKEDEGGEGVSRLFGKQEPI